MCVGAPQPIISMVPKTVVNGTTEIAQLRGVLFETFSILIFILQLQHEAKPLIQMQQEKTCHT